MHILHPADFCQLLIPQKYLMLRSISAFVLLTVDVFKLLLVASVLQKTVEKLLYNLENIDPLHTPSL